MSRYKDLFSCVTIQRYSMKCCSSTLDSTYIACDIVRVGVMALQCARDEVDDRGAERRVAVL